MIRPSLEAVQNYCLSRGNGIDAQAFIDYYEMIGWKVGATRKPMKDWQAAVRYWERNRKPKQQTALDRYTDTSWAN
jgi:hypothetical protein